MPDNKDNISIDEMMKNLKRGNDDDFRKISPQNPESDNTDSTSTDKGELVTRADGSKAMKVRSRKRRSHQPKKEKERKMARNKVILISGGVIATVLLGLAYLGLYAYYNGNRFSEKVATSIQTKSGAKVELVKLETSPIAAKIKNLNLDWKETNSPVLSLNLKEIALDYGLFSFLGTGWEGSEAQSATGELKLTLRNQPLSINSSNEGMIDFNFEAYKCNDLNIDIGKNGDWNVKGGQATYTVEENGNKQVYLYGGNLNAPFFDEYSIKSAVVNIGNSNVDLSLNIEPKKSTGSILLEGAVGYKAGDKVNLKTKFTNVHLTNWVDLKAHRFIEGLITSGTGEFKMEMGDFKSKEIITNVTSNKVVLKSFAFITTLSGQIQDRYYDGTPDFLDESSFKVEWLRDRVKFTDLKLNNKANLRIKGDFEIKNNGNISGSLKVGIPIENLEPVILKDLKKVFTEEDGDSIWTDVRVTGTTTEPLDDLAAQFKRANSDRIKKEGTSEDLFDLLIEEQE